MKETFAKQFKDGVIFMKKLVVIFPGIGYGLDSPLLYYADFVYETKGYDRIRLNFQSIFSDSELSLEEKLQKVREYILDQVKDIKFDAYDEVVFLSKSVGSVEAGILADKLNLNVVQVFITPIEEAISYCEKNSVVVIGTQDKAYELYKNHCDENMIKALYIKDANHSLEVEGQPYESIDVLKSVMHFIER